MEQIADKRAALYSPRQVFWAAFFGGPLALTYLLARNFNGLGRDADARRYLLVGFLLSLAILVVLIMLPGKASVGLFIGCAFAGQHMARDLHFGGAKLPAEGTPIHSAWRTTASTVLAFIVWLVLVIVAIMVLDATGYKIPD